MEKVQAFWAKYKDICYIFVLILVILLGFADKKESEQVKLPNSRYKVVKEGEYSPTFLIDTQTGYTWRNVNCGEKKNKVPNCWQSMEYLEESPLYVRYKVENSDIYNNKRLEKGLLKKEFLDFKFLYTYNQDYSKADELVDDDIKRYVDNKEKLKKQAGEGKKKLKKEKEQSK